MTRQLRKCVQYRKELENSLKIYDMTRQQVNPVFTIVFYIVFIDFLILNDLNLLIYISGSTPARKDYQYPRQFTATSPHDRIIQRFREAKNYLENSDNEVNTLI